MSIHVSLLTLFLKLASCAEIRTGLDVILWDPFGIFDGILLAMLLFLIIAGVARLLFHYYQINVLPESSISIFIGLIGGLLLWGAPFLLDTTLLIFPADVFFVILIPPIILEAGYFLSKLFFFYNLGTIVLYSIVGTVINAILTGAALFALSEMGLMRTSLGLSLAIAFASAVAAVDPVAVIAIFEEIHVNHNLNNLVFGESVCMCLGVSSLFILVNDAISIVLFRVAFGITAALTVATVALAAAVFVVNVVAGIIIGLIVAVLGAYLSKYSYKATVLEPLFLLTFAYLSFIIAELFHVSGHIAILVFGMVSSYYTEQNVSFFSAITIKYLLKLLAFVSETIIFIFLGLALFLGLADGTLVFDWALIGWTLLLMQLTRILSVIVLSLIANQYRIQKVSKRDMFILIYGGIRGPITFALVFIIPEDVEAREALLATALTVTLFTIIVQGGTIKPILHWLHIKKATVLDQETISYHLFERTLEYLQEAIEVVAGKHENWFYRATHWVDMKIQKMVLRAPLPKDETLTTAVENLMYKQAVENIKEQGGTPLTPKREEQLLFTARQRKKEAQMEVGKELEEAMEPEPPTRVIRPPSPSETSRHPVPRKKGAAPPRQVEIYIPPSPVTVSKFTDITDPGRRAPRGTHPSVKRLFTIPRNNTAQ
ncbi:hypothetical protein RCL1_005483 [Eukaryota sp. TZLM3-RCL]